MASSLEAGQPTNDELQVAWTAAIHSEGIAGSHADALQELRRLRDLRTTWYGKDSNDLMFALNRYLRGAAS